MPDSFAADISNGILGAIPVKIFKGVHEKHLYKFLKERPDNFLTKKDFWKWR